MSSASFMWDALGVSSIQIPINSLTFISHVLPLVVCYISMAILAITPQTRIFRFALWPTVTLLAIRAGYVDLSFGRPEFKFLSGELVRFMIHVVVHSLSWTLAEKPLVRHLRPVNTSPSIIMDALDLATNLRGHGWNWSRGLHVPRDIRPTHRLAFAFCTFLSALVNLFLCSITHQAIQTFVTGTQSSTAIEPTIFDDTLPFFKRHLRASLITILGGLMTLTGTQMNYELITVLGVLLFRQDPGQWPPAFDQPWRATSLTSLWGRRWHQTFRHTFVVCARPFQSMFGRPGAVCAAFIVSGLAHHLILCAYDGRSQAWRMLVGFGMMAPGVLLEHVVYTATGRRVGGVFGWVWTLAWMLTWGSLIIDGFTRVGMYAQPNAVASEVALLAMVERWVVACDAWLHAI